MSLTAVPADSPPCSHMDSPPAFSQSSHSGDGGPALGNLRAALIDVLAHPDHPHRLLGERPRLDDIGWRRARRSAFCSPARRQPSLSGGATEMLARAIVYAYVVLLAASLLLEQPIPLAISP